MFIMKMMERRIKKIARLFKGKLERRLGQAEVILFGSQARGEATPESDLDLCVIVERKSRRVREIILRCAWEVGFEHGMVLAPIIYSRKELAGVLGQSPMVENIRSEGIRL